MLPNFDELMKLALQDPIKLETLRQSWVEDIINKAPEHFQRRLRGLQFQIDMERQKASNPVSSCVRLSQMMHEGLASLQYAITQQSFTEDIAEKQTPAAIIPFPLSIAE